MQHWSAHELDRSWRDVEGPWLEFQRSDAMSSGLYVLGVGERDEQTPHTEDEVYVVLRGRAALVTPQDRVDVASGDVLFVPACEEHRFVDVTEELVLLVVFAPPEASASA